MVSAVACELLVDLTACEHGSIARQQLESTAELLQAEAATEGLHGHATAEVSCWRSWHT